MIKCKKLSILTSLAGILALTAVSVNADDLFYEDFNGYPTGLITGIPQISEGVTEVWYAGQIQSPDSTGLNNDVGVYNRAGLFQDDGGILFRVSTAGYTDVQLDFDWRTYSTSSSDNLVASYYVGSLNSFTDHTGDGTGSGRFADLRNVDFNQLLQNRNDSSWTDASFSNTDFNNQSEIWFAFWLDGGSSDYGSVDNVQVTATQIAPTITNPVPAAAWIGLTLLGGLGLTRKLKTTFRRREA